MADKEKIRNIMQFALLVAAQNDDYTERELGEIHLLKYVYLADMEYAKHHDGQTYTGTDWKFHHFGPYSSLAYTEIGEAVESLGAEKRTIQSRFSPKDYVRYGADSDEETYSKLKRELGIEIWGSVSGYVDKYKDNTGSLLHYVYATPPMLNAAPGERLNFSVMVEEESEAEEKEFVPLMDRISQKQKEELRQSMDELRKRFAKEKKKKPPRRKMRAFVKEYPVLEAGMAWLDSLAGEPFPENGAEVVFSDEVWKSEARRGCE